MLVYKALLEKKNRFFLSLSVCVLCTCFLIQISFRSNSWERNIFYWKWEVYPNFKYVTIFFLSLLSNEVSAVKEKLSSARSIEREFFWNSFGGREKEKGRVYLATWFDKNKQFYWCRRLLEKIKSTRVSIFSSF